MHTSCIATIANEVSRVFITIVTIHDLLIYNMDVKIVFRNENLNEQIYTDQPEGLIIESG